MVRLKVMQYVDDQKINGLDILGVSSVMEQLKYNSNVTYRHMTRFDAYRHNFSFKDYNAFGEECGFWVGIEHNSLAKDSGAYAKVDVTLEYNPNKCLGSPLLEFVVNSFFKDNCKVEVKSFDLAIDLPFNITCIKPVLKGNRSYRPQFYGGDNQTHYIGSRGSDGAIKIYNKARESGLKGVQLTRYEITIKPNVTIDNMVGLYGVNPGMFIGLNVVDMFQFDFRLSGTDKVLLLACMEHPEYLKELSRDKHKKIKQLLAENCSISFDYLLINKTINDFFKNIYTL